MYQLSNQLAATVSGGVLVHVTEEWKQDSANMSGAIFGFLGTIIGGGLSLSDTGIQSVPTIAAGSVAGAGIGYAIGYGCATLQNYFLKNNTYYEFTYHAY